MIAEPLQTEKVLLLSYKPPGFETGQDEADAGEAKSLVNFMQKKKIKIKTGRQKDL